MTVEPIKNDDKQLRAVQEVTSKVAENAVVPLGKTTVERSDKLDLSSQSQNLSAIEAKVISGAYNKPEIFRSVAMKLNEELPPEKAASK